MTDGGGETPRDRKVIPQEKPQRDKGTVKDEGGERVSGGRPGTSAPITEKVVEENEAVVSNGVGQAAKEKPKDTRTFRNAMDQLLAMVMPKEPGGDVPPLPITDNMEFSEEDEKKILERLTADDDDSDELLARKEMVQAMRDEYQELKKRGWKFVDYLKALDAKARLDTEVRDESIKLHETVFNDPNISDEKYKETLEKINKVLGDRGIKPIALPGSEPEEEEKDED